KKGVILHEPTHNLIAERMATFQQLYSDTFPDIEAEDPDCLDKTADSVVAAHRLLARQGDGEYFLQFINFSIAMCDSEVGRFEPSALRLMESMRSYVDWHRSKSAYFK